MTTIVTRTTKGAPLSWAEADANFTNLNTDKAELASPTFTGVPSADTATTGTNTTQLATTAFVQGKTATQTPFTATGNIIATNVQAAITEVDTEKVAKAGDTLTGVLSATAGLSVKSASTGTDDGNVVSGTYTPTGMTSSGINTKTAEIHRWLRVGNIVTVSGSLRTTSVAPGSVYVALAIPINSSFTTLYQAAGGGGITGVSGTGAVVVMSAGYANDVRVAWQSQSTAEEKIHYSFTYSIL